MIVILTEKICDDGEWYSGLQRLTQRCCSDLVITLIDKAIVYDRRHSTDFVKQALLLKGIKGWTLLHLAAEKGSIILVQKFLEVADELGIHVDILSAKLECGWTPSEVAQFHKHDSMISMLGFADK